MTMSYEPPSGAEDLAAQAEQLRREREEFEREKAEALERRAARMTAPPADEPVADEPAPEPEHEVDNDNEPVLDPAGEPVPKGDYERDTDGAILFDDAGRPYPRWQHDEFEYKGHTFQIKAAEPGALQAFQMMAASSLPEETQTRMYRQFVDSHLSLLSQTRVFDLMLAGEFTPEDYGEMFKRIARNGSARPTKPSRR